MVWIKDGLKSIQDIREGDEVLAWDPATNAPTLKPVVGTSSRMTDDIYRLTLSDAGGKQTTTVVTGSHPYLLAAANDNNPLRMAASNIASIDSTILHIIPGGEWRIVRFLKPGDKIRTALNGRLVRDVDGKLRLHGEAVNDLLTVVAVEFDRSPRRVYNFEVSGLHSYAVGELGEWVHNSQVCHRPINSFWGGTLARYRHCYFRFKDGTTVGFYDDSTSRRDPFPNHRSTVCSPEQSSEKDQCIRDAMAECGKYSALGNNCCQCAVESARVCGVIFPNGTWPNNWPANP